MLTSDNGLSPSLDTREFSAIGKIEFGVHGVQKQLEQLNVHKSTGPQKIPAQVLKMLSNEIAPMLTLIFQQSYNSGAVPYDWTKAMVVPIFKSGSRADPSNYRPISLACISCKVMEHIVLSHINKHLTVNNIITSFQQLGLTRKPIDSSLVPMTGPLFSTTAVKLTSFCLTLVRPLTRYHTQR